MRNYLRTQIYYWYHQQNKAIKNMFLTRAEGLGEPWDRRVSVQSIRDGINGQRCSAGTAKAIARAFGFPARWPELVVVPTKRGKP